SGRAAASNSSGGLGELGLAVRGGRDDHPTGDDHLHGGIDRHVELHDPAARQDGEEAAGGVERSGDVDAGVRLTGLLSDFGNVLGGQEAEAPDALPRVLDHYDLAEGIRLGKDDFGEALHPTVHGAHYGDVVQQLLAPHEQAPADEVGGE